MATVVWLMYLADLAASLSGVLAAGGIVALLACAGYRFGHAISHEFERDKPKPAPVRSYVIAAIVAIGVACFIPSKTTIYAAAAVAAGETALQTPTGDKAIRALNAWLDRQIADEGDKK